MGVFISHASIELSRKIICVSPTMGCELRQLDLRDFGRTYCESNAGSDRRITITRLAEHRSCSNKSVHEMMWSRPREVPAVDVQQNARPARADEPIVPNTPARGKERRSPILGDYGPLFVCEDGAGKVWMVGGSRWVAGIPEARWGQGFPRSPHPRRSIEPGAKLGR
jgi:hypothetical protein